MKKTAKKTAKKPVGDVRNGTLGRKHLGLHLQLTASECQALDAAIAREQAKVGDSAKVSASSYLLGLLRKDLKGR